MEIKMKYQIKVDKKCQSLYVIDKDKSKTIERMICSTGTEVLADGCDCITPTGTFRVKEIYDSIDWDWKGDSTRKRRPYGSYFCQLIDKYGKNVPGLHGTDEPKKLGKPASHGCIRIDNKDITKLVKKYIKNGTLVEIIGTIPKLNSHSAVSQQISN